MQPRFLDPATLAGISGLDLIAKTVVDGFVAGLHRSPDFGFSQEFAEYRSYNPGDDLRHVDWNVFARSERMYLKRYRGETNCQLTMMLDASASMQFKSERARISKLDYARYLASCLAYMAHLQRDAAGLIVFNENVDNYVTPSTRQGQLHRVLHAVEKAEGRARTDFSAPFIHFLQFLHRRGVGVVISDFWDDPDRIVHAVSPLRFRGNELVLFHILDPEEVQPVLREPSLLVDMETGDALEVSPDYVKHEYRGKMQQHIESLRDKSKGAGIDYFLITTDRPLDAALREYLSIRQGRM